MWGATPDLGALAKISLQGRRYLTKITEIMKRKLTHHACACGWAGSVPIVGVDACGMCQTVAGIQVGEPSNSGYDGMDWQMQMTEKITGAGEKIKSRLFHMGVKDAEGRWL